MKFAFTIVDVFSRSPFGGTQLAVLPDASGLLTDGMQQIAREFNFAETTFVLPAKDASNTCQVRIFTPAAELPFAGSPTIGTACALVMAGRAGAGDDHTLLLEEGIGTVSVAVEKRAGNFSGTLMLSGEIEQPSGAPEKQKLALVLSLHVADVKRVFFAGVGVPFCFVHVGSREAVDRAVVDNVAWTQHLSKAWSSNVFIFSGDLENGAELYARMSAPALGIVEDPATGSACGALVGAMAARREFTGDVFRLSIRQGVFMGRRGDIEACAWKNEGVVTAISVSGSTAHVASGEIEIPRAFLAR